MFRNLLQTSPRRSETQPRESLPCTYFTLNLVIVRYFVRFSNNHYMLPNVSCSNSLLGVASTRQHVYAMIAYITRRILIERQKVVTTTST